jgi:hypothetical protein
MLVHCKGNPPQSESSPSDQIVTDWRRRLRPGEKRISRFKGSGKENREESNVEEVYLALPTSDLTPSFSRGNWKFTGWADI